MTETKLVLPKVEDLNKISYRKDQPMAPTKKHGKEIPNHYKTIHFFLGEDLRPKKSSWIPQNDGLEKVTPFKYGHVW